jgi:hypothetical protein
MKRFTLIKEGKLVGKYYGPKEVVYSQRQVEQFIDMNPPVVERPKAAKRAARKKAPQQEVKKESKSRISER